MKFYIHGTLSQSHAAGFGNVPWEKTVRGRIFSRRYVLFLEPLPGRALDEFSGQGPFDQLLAVSYLDQFKCGVLFLRELPVLFLTVPVNGSNDFFGFVGNVFLDEIQVTIRAFAYPSSLLQTGKVPGSHIVASQ